MNTGLLFSSGTLYENWISLLSWYTFPAWISVADWYTKIYGFS